MCVFKLLQGASIDNRSFTHSLYFKKSKDVDRDDGGVDECKVGQQLTPREGRVKKLTRE